MARVTFNFRPQEVLQGNRNFIAQHAAQIESALMEVGLRIGADAVFEAPKPPLDWGVLRGSVNVATVSHAQTVDGGASPVARQRVPSDRPGRVLPGNDRTGLERFAVRTEFRTRYAAVLHETDEGRARSWPSKRIDPEVGPKFLSLKLHKNGKRYNALMAQAMKRRGLG